MGLKSKGRLPRLLILIVCVGLNMLSAQAQQSFQVSDPRPELGENVVYIYYDILNSKPEDRFSVDIEITDSGGDVVEARALKGDLGNNIEGGRNKRISWDLVSDQILINEQLFFRINVTPKPPAGPAGSAEVPVENQRSYTRTSLMLQSLALPGLGITRVTNKPHWIRGAIGYGCITGSVILNIQARNTYSAIDDYSEFEDKRNLYQTSVRQDRISDVLAYTSVGIWIADLIWTYVSTSGQKGGSAMGNGEKISLGYSLEPLSYTPQVSFVYRF